MATIDVVINKAGKEPIPVDMDRINALESEQFQFLFINGLKTVMERGLGKVKSKDLEGDELAKEQAKGREIVLKNLNDVYEGKFRIPGGKGSKLPQKVKTEAMRLARIAVKAAIKENGQRIKDYSAKEITELAAGAMEEDPSFVTEATANLAAAETKVTNLRSKLPTNKPKAEPKKPPQRAAKGDIVAAAKRRRGEQAQATH